MAFTIALAGKGGTGKTTTAALIVRALRDLGASSVLAVDADPNACLHDSLGVEVERSVGEITESMLGDPDANPGGMSKAEWVEYNIQRYLVETRDFDLLSMGRPEGSGCYCYANNLVRGAMDALSRGYEYVVMDNEAGLEHLSRRTTRNVDLLLLVADPAVRGVRTAETLNQLADELEIAVGSRYVIINRTSEPLHPALQEAVAETGLPLLGVVPSDEGIALNDLNGASLFELPADSPALARVRDMIAQAIPALGSAAA
jgi:CO dehydrogenase maturation factor